MSDLSKRFNTSTPLYLQNPSDFLDNGCRFYEFRNLPTSDGKKLRELPKEVLSDIKFNKSNQAVSAGDIADTYFFELFGLSAKEVITQSMSDAVAKFDKAERAVNLCRNQIRSGAPIPSVKIELSAAFKVITEVAKVGYLEALFLSGHMHFEFGEILGVSKKDGVDLMDMARAPNSTVAKRLKHYSSDKGNFKQDSGHDEAILALGTFFFNLKDWNRAEMCFLEREYECTISMYHLGKMSEGGVLSKEKRAAVFYKRAMDKGHKESTVAWASLVLEGTEIEIEKGEVESKLITALECGSVAAVYVLAMMYKRGMLVSQDLSKCRDLIMLLLSFGSIESTGFLEMIALDVLNVWYSPKGTSADIKSKEAL